ncbi:MAG: hypothetical protein F4X50_00765 [Synechococcus sp. SB0662_bin_14]|nr:hypothetical protein [Synechococcus sp. SB0662_bin_14]
MGLLTQASDSDQDKEDKELKILKIRKPEIKDLFSGYAGSLIKDDDPLNISEGKTLVFYVNLNRQPTSPVKVNILPNILLKDNQKQEIDLEKSQEIFITPNSLTFTEDSWQTPQAVTFLLDNNIDKENEKINICFDPSGDGYTEPVVLDLVIANDDTRGLTLNSPELIVTEGGAGSFSVKLDTEPTEPIVIKVSVAKNKDEDSEQVFLDSDYFVKPFYFTKEDWENVTTEQLQNLKAGFSQFFPISLNYIDQTRRTFQALANNFSHFNNDSFIINSHFLVFSVVNWNIPQSVMVFVNENQKDQDDRWTIVSLDPFGGGYDNNQSKEIEIEIKDTTSPRPSPQGPIVLTLFIGANILALKFAVSAKINDIDIKLQNKENDLLSEIDEKVADIKTEVEEIKEDVEEIKDKIE